MNYDPNNNPQKIIEASNNKKSQQTGESAADTQNAGVAPKTHPPPPKSLPPAKQTMIGITAPLIDASENKMDSAKANMESAKANMESAKANMESAKANMESAKANDDKVPSEDPESTKTDNTKSETETAQDLKDFFQSAQHEKKDTPPPFDGHAKTSSQPPPEGPTKESPQPPSLTNADVESFDFGFNASTVIETEITKENIDQWRAEIEASKAITLTNQSPPSNAPLPPVSPPATTPAFLSTADEDLDEEVTISMTDEDLATIDLDKNTINKMVEDAAVVGTAATDATGTTPEEIEDSKADIIDSEPDDTEAGAITDSSEPEFEENKTIDEAGAVADEADNEPRDANEVELNITDTLLDVSPIKKNVSATQPREIKKENLEPLGALIADEIKLPKAKPTQNEKALSNHSSASNSSQPHKNSRRNKIAGIFLGVAATAAFLFLIFRSAPAEMQTLSHSKQSAATPPLVSNSSPVTVETKPTPKATMPVETAASKTQDTQDDNSQQKIKDTSEAQEPPAIPSAAPKDLPTSIPLSPTLQSDTAPLATAGPPQAQRGEQPTEAVVEANSMPTPSLQQRPFLPEDDSSFIFPARFNEGTATFWFIRQEQEDAFLAQLLPHADGKQIFIYGYVTPQEKEKKLNRLAISRAWAVQKYVQRKGISQNTITAQRGNLRKDLPTQNTALVTIVLK